MKTKEKNNKKKIIDTAFILAMEKGFDNVSIKQLQKETGLAPGSIYDYFKDKDDILINILQKHLFDNFSHFKKKIEDFDGTFLEKMRFIFQYKAHSYVHIDGESIYEGQEFTYKEFFTFLVSIFHNHPEVRHLFYQLYDGLYLFIFGLFYSAVNKNEIRDDLDLESLVIYFQTLLEGYINLWIVKPNYPIEKILDINLGYFWNSIKK